MKTLNLMYVLLLSTLTLMSSCIGCQKEKSDSEKMEEAVSDLTDNIENASKDIEGGLTGALNQLEEAVGNMNENGEKKELINFREIKKLYEESVGDWKRISSSGESNKMGGYGISQANAKYQKGDKIVTVEAIDAGGIGIVAMSAAAWSMIEVDKEDENGYERTTTYKGSKAFEKCRRSRCEFNVFAGKRFILNVKGKGKEETVDDFKELLGELGLIAGLEKLDKAQE